MNELEFIEDLKIDDLGEDQKQLAELIGLDKYRLLLKTYGGMSIYIPKPDSLTVLARNEQIRREFDGTNFKELAHKYGLTEVWIRNIVSEKSKELKEKPIDGQFTMFDYLKK